MSLNIITVTLNMGKYVGMHWELLSDVDHSEGFAMQVKIKWFIMWLLHVKPRAVQNLNITIKNDNEDI